MRKEEVKNKILKRIGIATDTEGWGLWWIMGAGRCGGRGRAWGGRGGNCLSLDIMKYWGLEALEEVGLQAFQPSSSSFNCFEETGRPVQSYGVALENALGPQALEAASGATLTEII